MRVLWIVRHNLEQHPGGDTTQILQTRQAVERLGVSVEMSAEQPPDLSAFDVVHLFHLDRLWEHLSLCRRMRAAALPVVLSTIYWPSDEFDRGGRRGMQGVLARSLGSDRYQSIRQLQRFALRGLRRRSLHDWDRRLCSFQKAARSLLHNVAVILPNSVAEQRVIEGKFGLARPVVVVPNAVDIAAFAAPDVAPANPRGGVLAVGRIEPRKNQLMLIRALCGSEIPLTLIGSAGRYNRRYARQCRREAGSNVRFVEHEDAVALRENYRAARVHANVSWYETPGLASLEAGLCGCHLVVTPGGSTREYFGDRAEYCDPCDAGSIRAALEAAFAREPEAELSARIRQAYNWSRAADATLRGYELALRSEPSGGPE